MLLLSPDAASPHTLKPLVTKRYVDSLQNPKLTLCSNSVFVRYRSGILYHVAVTSQKPHGNREICKPSPKLPDCAVEVAPHYDFRRACIDALA